MRERKFQRSKSAEIRSLYRQFLQVGLDSVIFRKFILEKFEEVNIDLCVFFFDLLQMFVYEGIGLLVGFLSFLVFRDIDQEDDFDYFNDLGFCFKRLVSMFGFVV